MLSMRAAKGRFLLLLILVLAFLLRGYRLDYQDLWGDEGTSYHATTVALPDAMYLDVPVHPPFYYLLLNLWVRAAGQSAFALRFLSVAFGMLGTVCMYGLAHSLFGSRAGLLAVLVCAMSPVQVYYSQEARMYSLLFLEATVLTWLLALQMQSTAQVISSDAQQSRVSGHNSLLWGAYLITALAALYTHYYALLILIAHSVLGGCLWRRSKRQLITGSVVLATLFLAYLPWVLSGMTSAGTRVKAQFEEWDIRSLLTICRDGLSTLCVGPTVQQPLASYMAMAFCVIAGIGLVATLNEKESKHKGWLLFLCLAIPLAGAWFIDHITAFFHPRYLLVSLPAFCVLIAYGLERIGHGRPLAISLALVGLVAVSSYSLGNHFFNDAFAKGKYGAMLRYVQAKALAQDLLLLNNREQMPLFHFYRPQGIPYAFFPQDKAGSDADVHSEMLTLCHGYSRVWLVMFGDPAVYDPEHRVEQWLGEHGYKSFGEGFQDAYLSLYVLPPLTLQQGIQDPLRVNLGNKVLLTGYRLSPDSVRASDTLFLTLYWQCLDTMDLAYTVFTHLLDGQNGVAAQMDSQPAGGTRPTTGWRPGEVVEDKYGLYIPPGTPPGEYVLEVGMYYWPTMQRLSILDEQGLPKDNRVLLGEVQVVSQ